MKNKKPHKKNVRAKGNILVVLISIVLMLCAFFGSSHMWIGFAVSLSTAALLFIILIIQARKKNLKIKVYISIFLVVLIGIGIMFCVIFGSNREWIGFSVCLSAVVLLFIIVIPLTYSGDTYECPKCGHKFKANPYKVFFTNGILRIFDLDGGSTKSAKLKCPNCKTKDWCKIHWQ